MNSNLDQLADIIRKTLELPDDFALRAENTPADVPGWDSLGWIKIINAVQSDLNLSLPLEKLAEVNSISNLLTIVADCEKPD